ncbi:class I SAM-dependent methyltransferase [Negativibacillus massiliensis]|uniref:class I SAM-dependent methyltransferase n=1 Tax=Negativibacillus massiliensis TaxID=1871035 RepID=UPI002A82CFA5|nr:class I SAM-dependent methyltransferase [Negativibacillus massiliensis]MDY4046875.1 class I SAM-dependent methyltransferase [Negativibacillus massiliensis]
MSRPDSQLPPETILIEDAAFFREKGSVLDLACGDGRNALFLAGNGFEVTAVDFSEAALSRLKRFAEKERLTVYTQQMDLCCEENFNSLGKFDMIVCNHYRLLSKTAMQLKKHLTKNGVLWINGFAECPQDNPAIRQSDLIVKEDYLQIGYQLEDEKEYQVEEHKFIRLILKTEGADC